MMSRNVGGGYVCVLGLQNKVKPDSCTQEAQGLV